MFLIQEHLLTLKVVGVSYTSKMCPHEQSSGGLVTSQEVLSPCQGWGCLNRQTSLALLLVPCCSCSVGTTLELCTVGARVQTWPWLSIPDWPWGPCAGRMGSKVTNWKFMIVFVEDKGQGTEIPMFLQRCAFITVSLSQFKCLFEQRFLFLQRDSVHYILNELAANGTIAIV